MTNNTDISYDTGVNALNFIMFEVDGKMYGVGRDYVESKCQQFELDERAKGHITDFDYN
jgi:hypothetical protein